MIATSVMNTFKGEMDHLLIILDLRMGVHSFHERK
jgi:hypothetical protein